MKIPVWIGAMSAVLAFLPGACAGTLIVDGLGAGSTFYGLGVISGGGGDGNSTSGGAQPHALSQ
jgi:hypothetical protein